MKTIANFKSWVLFRKIHFGFGNPDVWREIHDLLEVCTGGEKVFQKKEKLLVGFMKGKKWRTSIKFSSNLVASYSVVAMSGWLPRLSFCKCRNHEGRTSRGVYKKSKNLYNFTKTQRIDSSNKRQVKNIDLQS